MAGGIGLWGDLPLFRCEPLASRKEDRLPALCGGSTRLQQHEHSENTTCSVHGKYSCGSDKRSGRVEARRSVTPQCECMPASGRKSTPQGRACSRIQSMIMSGAGCSRLTTRRTKDGTRTTYGLHSYGSRANLPLLHATVDTSRTENYPHWLLGVAHLELYAHSEDTTYSAHRARAATTRRVESTRSWLHEHDVRRVESTPSCTPSASARR